ncbi:TMEM165/GDT1 family protein [Altericroceibacterium endophyticum]|uniref:GDT1 family protein n=1 Tax=Altericroceibacterium endophyticum TaxID=1808508 RepID=A0A6I4T0N2_9SPHN|nr:TMEM165/GDT1 family protein [Altericroceibacterium endophyticum]MXO64674.1 UPF0016 domain-containing protein [Altericroceibacterium endophyticum]
MEAFLTSTLVVALAEIGDKTQLLAIVLAARFRRPIPIIAGILIATLANHCLAALVGERASFLLDGDWFRYIVAGTFILMAGWTLIPDTLEEKDQKIGSMGAFASTLISFFLVEMGDKTQLATITLGAQFKSVLWVTAGTTLGMMIANVPAVLLGQKIIDKVPLALVRAIAAAMFAIIGVWLFIKTMT